MHPRQFTHLDGHNAYDVLGVDQNATRARIESARRRLAGRVHPDLPGGDAATMSLVNAAAAILLDDVQRAAYDAYVATLRPAPAPSRPDEPAPLRDRTTFRTPPPAYSPRPSPPPKPAGRRSGDIADLSGIRSDRFQGRTARDRSGDGPNDLSDAPTRRGERPSPRPSPGSRPSPGPSPRPPSGPSPRPSPWPHGTGSRTVRRPSSWERRPDKGLTGDLDDWLDDDGPRPQLRWRPPPPGPLARWRAARSARDPRHRLARASRPLPVLSFFVVIVAIAAIGGAALGYRAAGGWSSSTSPSPSTTSSPSTPATAPAHPRTSQATPHR
jgi:curved DNA-binding protein CbpA